MGHDEIREWLDAAWQEALIEADSDPDPNIDRMTNSKVVSIRYALFTQMLGKIADPARSLLALQNKAPGEGAWDARSFSTAIVVPWVTENHNIIGTSAEPYVSKPLRRARLGISMQDVRNKKEWKELVSFFEDLDEAPTSNLEHAFRSVLRSLVRKLAEQTFTYPIPQRLSLLDLQSMLTEFLSVPSGGLRQLAIAAALFKTLGEGFSLFSEVRSQGINEADAATGMPGDIMCYDGNEICLVVEVKDNDLTLAHVQASTRKAKNRHPGWKPCCLPFLISKRGKVMKSTHCFNAIGHRA